MGSPSAGAGGAASFSAVSLSLGAGGALALVNVSTSNNLHLYSKEEGTNMRVNCERNRNDLTGICNDILMFFFALLQLLICLPASSVTPVWAHSLTS